MKIFRYLACAILLLSLFFLPEPNRDYLFLQSVRQLAADSFDASLAALKKVGEEKDSAFPFRAAWRLDRLTIDGAAAEGGSEQVEREVRRLLVQDHDQIFLGLAGDRWFLEQGRITKAERTGAPVRERIIPFSLQVEKGADAGSMIFDCPDLGVHRQAERPYFKLYSVLPPFLAILLALLFQRTLLALFCGVWLGATLLEGFNPLLGFWRFLRQYFYEEALLDQFRVDIIGFVIALCATVGLLTRGGGIQGFVNMIVRFAKTVRSTQFVTYLMGIAIFFDDYTNCIIVGNTTRPLADRMRISREKLSYIVDSTAAPVAGLSLLSTWIAYEVSTFSPQLPEAGVTEGAYDIFFQTIPYRFYCILTLAFIAFQIFFRRDFGPMLRAERRARSTGEVLRQGGQPLVSSSMTKIKPKEGAPARWLNAFLPIFVIIAVTVEEMWRIGGGWQRPLKDLFSPTAIREVLGVAADLNSAKPIFIGALAGFGLAMVLMLGQRILTLGECIKAAAASTKALFFAIAILFMAWCIGGVCSDIGTAHYLIALFQGVIHPLLFPTILFLTACIVSFATGSSWSTMSILLPNTVIFAVKMGEISDLGAMPMLVISIGAVLEGSIFGDHCSPISDTTILSSVSCAADHMDHIKTQAPYAMVTMVAAIVIGYIPAACGVHPAISIATGLLILIGVLFLLGRKPDKVK
jgi:Na+/H+ antiporter NhaC